MLNRHLCSSVFRGMLAAVVLAGALFVTACDADTGSGSASTGESAEAPDAGGEPEQERPELPDSWVISISDDDTFTEGEITYTIAMNLTATNPTQSIAGAYTGSATAVTTTTGVVQGQPLNASATVNSTKLEFTLMDALGNGALAPLTEEEADSEALAPLTAEDAVYSGTGTIVMAAAGSGTIGPAGGSFGDTSGQQVEVTTQGSTVTFKVAISGHTYTFEGTLQGQ